jgi:hypothetical protein
LKRTGALGFLQAKLDEIDEQPTPTRLSGDPLNISTVQLSEWLYVLKPLAGALNAELKQHVDTLSRTAASTRPGDIRSL